MSVEELPGWAAQYVGIPYVPGGRDRAGIDCWGLYSLIMHEQFGMALPPYEGPTWGSSVSGRAIAAAAVEYARQFAEVPQDAAGLGDAVLFRMFGLPIHVGMVLGRGLFIHAEYYQNSVIARYNSPQWASRVVSFFRWNPDG